MRELRYTVRNIGANERKSKEGLEVKLQKAMTSIEGLVDLVAIGLAEKEVRKEDIEEAYDVIQEALDSGKTVYGVADEVIEMLSKAGFMTEALENLKISEMVKEVIDGAKEEMKAE